MLDLELFALLERTADAAYTVSGDGEICSWNAAAERLFGYAAADVIGRNIDDVLDARDASAPTRSPAVPTPRRGDGMTDGWHPSFRPGDPHAARRQNLDQRVDDRLRQPAHAAAALHSPGA